MREADLTTFMCRISWKSGSLNLLEPSGPHRACYETALSLPWYGSIHSPVIKQNNQPGTVFEYVDTLSDKACMVFVFHKQEDFSLTHMAAILENLCFYMKGDDCVFQGNFAVVGRNIFVLLSKSWSNTVHLLIQSS